MSGKEMSWADKYWDIISNLYWTPRYLGLQSISRSKWKMEGDRVSIPMELIENASGPLYTRSRKFSETKEYLSGQEEILNHFFDIAFSIAGDEVVSKLLCHPLNIVDAGPFNSIGREIGQRYGWRKDENVTQQDGFFITSSSIIAVELKLGSTSWPEQIAKYIALMIWEESFSGQRQNLGLLFIVPESALAVHWSSVGLEGPAIHSEFVRRLSPDKLPKKIQDFFDQRSIEVQTILQRLRLTAISWKEFRNNIEALERDLDPTYCGDQTLQKLLSGLRQQINAHAAPVCKWISPSRACPKT